MAANVIIKNEGRRNAALNNLRLQLEDAGVIGDVEFDQCSRQEEDGTTGVYFFANVNGRPIGAGYHFSPTEVAAQKAALSARMSGAKIEEGA